MISFDNVTKEYPDGTVAVDQLTLDVPDGTLAVFVGPSGCGKTTSMRMINRMIDPTSGTLTIDGEDVTKVDPVKLRLGIGYVIQSAGLMPHQRVIDNVATVPVLKGQSRRAARKAALGVLERVGLNPKLANRYPAQLSGGQQQRVGVARALAADPPILLMDEPFSAVDPVVRDELQAEMLRLQSELHKTVVFVTHDIDEAVKLGDKVAVFGPGGALQQYDEPARLLTNPANDFVSGFIGADRGYRGLQFFHASGLPLHEIRRASEDEIDGLNLADGDWALVKKPDGSPYGWIDAEGVQRHREGNSLYDSVVAGGSLFHPDGTLRQALDAALSSPSGLGVAVDGDGQVIGGVRAEDVLEALEKQRQGPAGQERRRLGGWLSVRYLLTHLDDAWELTLIHLRLSLIPIVLGLLIAVPLGALVQRTTTLRRLTTVTASIIFTIPSLALFVVLPLIIPTRILDEANVIVALTLYTTALLVRAVPEALDAVPAPVRDAATAVGYKPLTRMLKVDLPLAIPVLVAGLRVVAVTNISMVAVGSVIGIGGLGTWFTEGYQADKSDQIIAGIIAIFVLAIVVDTLIMVAGRLLTPWTRAARPARVRAKAAAQ